MSGLTRWELVAYALSALLVFSAAVFWPVVRNVDPVLAVAIASADGRIGRFELSAAEDEHRRTERVVVVAPDDLLDPWGQPWRCLAGSRTDRRWFVFSIGPDRRGDWTGDEIATGAWGYRTHPVSAAMPRRVRQWPRLTLAASGVALALWTLLMTRVIRAPLHRRRRREAVRAALISALPASWAAAWILAGVPLLTEPQLTKRLSDAGGIGSQLPASVAVPLTWGLTCYLPALAWRLSRPRDETPLPSQETEK